VTPTCVALNDAAWHSADFSGEDAFMPYDRQLIYCLVPGGRDANEDNRVAYSNAQALDLKQDLAAAGIPSQITTLSARGTPDLSDHQNRIVGNVRVYIVGHGTAESSTIGDLNAAALAAMIRTLVVPPARIQRLGLVGCFSGLSEIVPDRAAHRLVTELWPLVDDRVREITGYTGEVAVRWRTDRNGANNPAAINVVRDRATVYAVAGTGEKVVTQQSMAGGRMVPRKIIIDAAGTRWLP